MRARAGWRVAIAGAGLMGRWHAHAVRRIGGSVAVVIDPDERAGRALAARYRGRWTPALADALASASPVNAVHVCTPTGTHAALITEALQAGRHVLVEKPLAPSTGVAEALLALARDRALVLCPVHQLLFQPGVRTLKRRLPDLGELRHLEFVACSAGAAGAGPAAAARLVRDILPHPLSLFRHLTGLPVAGVTWHAVSGPPGEFRALAAVADVSIALLISAGGRPTRNALRAIGTHSTAHLDLFHGFCVFQPGQVSRPQKIWSPFGLATRTALAAGANLVVRATRREPAYPGLRELIRRFAAAASGGHPWPIPAEESLDVMAATDALAARVASGH